MKTVELIECKICGGTYFSGKNRTALIPGDENTLPDEVYIIVKKTTCIACKEKDSRTRADKRRRRLDINDA